MSFHVEHEWDEDGECSIAVTPELPCWKFSLWDVAGIGLTTVGGFFSVMGQGLNLLARECQAAAQYSRQTYDEAREAFEEERARAEMAGALEGLVMFDPPAEPGDFS